MEKYNNIEEIVKYIIKNKSTIRKAAKEYNIPKSTLYDRIIKYMEYCDESIYKVIRETFDYNIKIKNKNGGEAFKNKYTGQKRIDIIKNKY